TFWPKDLCLELNWPIADDPWEIYGKGAIILAALVTGFVLLRLRPAIGFLIVTFFLILAPSSTIVPLYLAFEHRMYLSLACISIGVVLLVYWCVRRLSQRIGLGKSGSTGVLGVLFFAVPLAITLAILTRQHNETYNSSLSIWQNVVRIAPHNVRARMNLGVYLGRAGRYAEAESQFRIALEELPTYHACWYNLGLDLHRDRQMPERAVEALQKAVDLKPNEIMYQFALAAALEGSGEIDAAEASYRRCLEVLSDEYEPHHNLGRLLRKKGELQEAEQLLKRAIELNPASWRSHAQLAKLQIGKNESASARQHYEDAIACFQGRPSPWVLDQQLAWLLATSPEDSVRDGERAVRLARSAVEAQGSQPICWDTLAAAQAEVGQFEDAEQSAATAAKLPESTSSKMHSLAEIQKRIELYRRRQKYRAEMVRPDDASVDAPPAEESAR
ncbi:MAG: tetratricopeptide repeat protein, partial [Planctomycetota bacterium]